MKKVILWIFIIGLFITAINDCNDLENQLEKANKTIEEYEDISKTNKELKKETEQLKKENEKLKKENNNLKEIVEKFKKEEIKKQKTQQEKKEVISDTPKEISNIKDKEIINSYQKLPNSVKTLFKDLDVELLEVDNISSDYNLVWDSYVGFFEYRYGYNVGNYARIQIKKTAPNKTHTTLHEFGHLLDCGYNKEYESDDNEFLDIYYNERNDYKTDYNYQYAISSSTEYFADAFAEYIKNPKQLKANTPRTYEYVVNAINNIK